MKTNLCSNYRARIALLTAITALSGFGGLGFSSTAFAADADLPQLLERAIYSEETKGDLDSAMGLYQQIVADANASQKLAAQAQLRLAICYDKKKDYTAATAAFEKLVHDFPAQKEYVALANEYLATGLPLLAAPWPDREEMLFQIKAPTGVKAGVISYYAKSGSVDGRNVWNLQMHALVGANILSGATVEATSFKPLSSQFSIPMVGDFGVHYGVGSADVSMPGQPAPKHVEISGIVYDNESVIELMRRLPLAVGYKATIKILTSMGSGTILPVEASVVGQEKLTVPAGTFDAFKIVLSVGQTYWYSSDEHRYLLKLEVLGGMAELLSVTQRSTDPLVVHQDSALHFAFSTPQGWLTMRKEDDQDQKSSTIFVGDVDGLSTTQVKVGMATNWPADAQVSPRAFADYQIKEWKRWVKEVTVREDTWKDTTINGNPAVTCICEQVLQNGMKQTVLVTYGFVAGKAVDIGMCCADKDVAKLQPAYEALVKSYKPL